MEGEGVTEGETETVGVMEIVDVAEGVMDIVGVLTKVALGVKEAGGVFDTEFVPDGEAELKPVTEGDDDKDAEDVPVALVVGAIVADPLSETVAEGLPVAPSLPVTVAVGEGEED